VYDMSAKAMFAVGVDDIQANDVHGHVGGSSMVISVHSQSRRGS